MIAREDRDRYEDRARRPPGSEVPRKVYGRIVDGGNMPDSTDDGQVVYLLERVDVDFAEESGATATVTGSGARFTAVRVGGKGPKAPAVGDVVVCRPIGDRLGFVWAGGKGPHVKLWVLSRGTQSTNGFAPGFVLESSPAIWMTDVFAPTARDATRFDVFAFWKYDVDTGADFVTSSDFSPDSIPEKQHIIHSRMSEVRPSRIDHPWGYLEIPSDTSGIHANNKNPAGSIVVRVTDTSGDPEWEAIALLPVSSYFTNPDGSHPDVFEFIAWGVADFEYKVSDQLTWHCPGHRPRPSPPGTVNPASDHSFAGADVTVTYHNRLTFLPFSAVPSKDVAKDATTESEEGYWQWRRPAITGGLFDREDRLDTVTNESLGVLPGFVTSSLIGRTGQYLAQPYQVAAPAYTPTSATVNPTVLSVSLCKQSYGYVSVPVGASPPFTAPGCIPPHIKISINATAVWDGHTAIAPGIGAISPNPTTKDLKQFFGDYAGASTTLDLVTAAIVNNLLDVRYASECVVNKGLPGFATNGRYTKLLVDSAGANSFYTTGGSMFVGVGPGPGIVPCQSGNSGGNTFFTPENPPCTGSRPTSGPIHANYPYVYDQGGNTVSFRYLIGEWSY